MIGFKRTPKPVDTHPLHFGYTTAGVPSARQRLAKHATEWAVIVNHGMGQQLRFETLEQIVLALRTAECTARESTALPNVRTRIVRLPTRTGKPMDLLRAEMVITDQQQQQHSVHVYESYWAPLTEGQVSLTDCIQFLLGGFFRGIVFLVRNGARFDRWVFGGMKRFPVRQVLTALKLLAGVTIMFAPVVLGVFVTVAQVSSLVLGALGMHSIDRGAASGGALVFQALTPTLALFEIILTGFAVGSWLLPKVSRLKWLVGRIGFLGSVRRALEFAAVVASGGSLLLLVALEGWFAVHGWRLFTENAPAALVPGIVAAAVPDWAASATWGGLMLAVIWLVAAVIALVCRWFLIEYVGDVAVYLSANRLSKFDALRDRIQESVFDVMDAVYNATGDSGLLYDKVAVVGHSLGSVISYDTVDRLLVLDELAAAAQSPGRAVRARSKVLLTFGSPLDKTAYLFRIKGPTDELREAAAAQWQPLIRDYSEFRPDQWINIYSWMDIVSGKLTFYDDPENGENGGTRRILNERDPGAFLPLAAHVQYWTSGKLGAVLYNCIT